MSAGCSIRVKIKEEITRASYSKLFQSELTYLEENYLLRELRFVESPSGPIITINGQDFINFSSNDYLNLSSHPEIIGAAVSGLKKYGFGSGASRLLSGSYLSHKKLEDRIARFKSSESALLFNTGYAANTGIIPSITGPDDIIFSDELNHASLIDGARLSKAAVKVYKHRDPEHLESLLKDSSSRSAKKRLIITDTVFSMDGDIAPLKDLYLISKKHDAILMIDDAHGTGVLGRSGRGAVEHFGIKRDNIIQMGTLSKAAGSFGAFVTGSKYLIDYLINKARSFIYSTALPPAVAEAGAKAIDIIDKRSVRARKRLWRNRERLQVGLGKLGYNTLDSETPIIPVLVGDNKRALTIGKYLLDNNIFAPAIRPPTVPEGKCRLRFTVTSAHSNEHIDRLIELMGNL